MKVRDCQDALLTTVAGAAFLIVILAAVLSGCTPTVKHEAPQLQAASDSIRSTSESIRKIVVEGCKPTPRVTLDMPPLPDKANISIDGTTLKADEGGIAILRAYVKARELLKP